MGYRSIDSHRPMALDDVRNRAYREALAEVVRPDSVVLDLGAGLGILGLLAASLGARKVYCVEPEDVVQVAQEIAARNGVSDRVECLRGRLEQIELPEPVDVIVSALTGNMLFTEDLLPTLFRARDRCLKPGGVLIPEAATVSVVPVSAPALYARRVEVWSRLHLEVDLSPARGYAANSVHYVRPDELAEARQLAEPTELLRMSFHDSRYEALAAAAEITTTAAGPCHGIAGWFAIRLGGRWLSTGPRDPATHWSPLLFPLDPPLELRKGDKIGFQIERPPYGEWTWTVETGSSRQRRSTFMAMPLTPETLAEINPAFVPERSEEGRAALRALTLMDGSHSRQDLVDALIREFPEMFAESEGAAEWLDSLMSRFGRAPDRRR